MTLYHATVVDTPGDPFTGDPAAALRYAADAGLLVRDGVITARGSFASLRTAHPDEPVVELTDGLLLPGFVDTHVHYPQMRAMGGLGMPLLDWLEKCALPEEANLAPLVDDIGDLAAVADAERLTDRLGHRRLALRRDPAALANKRRHGIPLRR